MTYSNHLKENLLGVSAETLKKHGAVSREVVHEMWNGLMKKTGADYGIAVSGIAGPKGGTPEKPVGTVFYAMGKKGEQARSRYSPFQRKPPDRHFTDHEEAIWPSSEKNSLE